MRRRVLRLLRHHVIRSLVFERLLLAASAAGAAGFRALLHGVNAGGCGTPIASLANLIGAQVFAREGGDGRAFWRSFLPVSAALLGLLVLVSLLLVS